jgi:hypothetical protein
MLMRCDGTEVNVRNEYWLAKSKYHRARDRAHRSHASGAWLGGRSALEQRMKKRARRAAGIALIAVGVITTVPLALRVRGELE